MSTDSVAKLKTLSCRYCFVLLVVCFNALSALEIRRLAVPRWVANGTKEGVVLDCEYQYTENDLRLVIKWFFNDTLEPVYQWIPQLNLRHVSGVLYGRLDMEYSASPEDPYSQYRALKIINPTPELSGKYSCLIMSLAGQDSRHQEMTVYAPANVFQFEYTLPHEDLVNFTCTALGVYPEPRMKIFYVLDGKHRRVFEGETRTIVRKNNASFDITHWTAPNSRELPLDRASVVDCYLEIFGSPFRRTTRIIYTPGVPGFHGIDPNPASRPINFVLLQVLLPLLVAVVPRWKTRY